MNGLDRLLIPWFLTNTSILLIAIASLINGLKLNELVKATNVLEKRIERIEIERSVLSRGVTEQ